MEEKEIEKEKRGAFAFGFSFTDIFNVILFILILILTVSIASFVNSNKVLRFEDSIVHVYSASSTLGDYGKVLMEQEGNRIKMTSTLQGLTAGYTYSLHILSYNKADEANNRLDLGKANDMCNQKEGTAGELGNLIANDDGAIDLLVYIEDLKVTQVLGRTLSFMLGGDDCESSTSGESLYAAPIAAVQDIPPFPVPVIAASQGIINSPSATPSEDSTEAMPNFLKNEEPKVEEVKETPKPIEYQILPTEAKASDEGNTDPPSKADLDNDLKDLQSLFGLPDDDPWGFDIIQTEDTRAEEIPSDERQSSSSKRQPRDSGVKERKINKYHDNEFGSLDDYQQTIEDDRSSSILARNKFHV